MVLAVCPTFKDFFGSFSFQTLLAFIGALAWLPWLVERCQEPKIFGRVISYALNDGNFNHRNGILHFFKLSITTANQNIHIKELKISVKYPGDENWYKGKIFWGRYSSWLLDDIGTLKQLIIPPDQFIGFTNFLAKDKTNFYYLTFIVENRPFGMFEKVKFDFSNFKDGLVSFEIDGAKIDNDEILFDDSIWR